MSKATWWSEGVKFECQGSGKCCVSRGEYGYVYLTLEDRRRIAKHLKIKTSEFTRKHCKKKDGWFFLNEPEKACQFLDHNKCTVYTARPSQCRTWPFWPENMSSRAWMKEVVSFCPGVGKGKLYTKSEIEVLINSDPLLD